MARLYELTADYKALYDALDDIDLDDPEQAELLDAVMTTADGIEEEFNTKVENIGMIIKEMAAFAAACKLQKESFDRKKRQAENKVERLKMYLHEQMRVMGAKKAGGPNATVSIRKNPPKLCVINAAAVMDAGYEKVTVEVDNAAVKEALKKGVDVPGAMLYQGEGVTIK